MEGRFPHEPVLLEETLGHLLRAEGGVYVDATVGGGGHAAELLRRLPQARLLGFDRDAETLALARERLAAFGERAVLFHEDFRRMGTVLKKKASAGSPGCLRTSVSVRCIWTIPRGASRSARTGLWT